MRIGMIHRLDGGQHRDASHFSSTLSLESSGAGTRLSWLEYSWTKNNILDGQWETAHTECLLSAMHHVKSLNTLIIPILWGRYSLFLVTVGASHRAYHPPPHTHREIDSSVECQDSACPFLLCGCPVLQTQAKTTCLKYNMEESHLVSLVTNWRQSWYSRSKSNF